MKRLMQSFAAIICVLGTLFATGSGPAALAQKPAESRVLTNSIVGDPVVNDQFVFWLDDQNGDLAIKGYDLIHRSTLMIGASGLKWDLASSPTALAWVASSPQGASQINLYTIATGATQVLYETPAYISNLAMTETALFFQDGTAGHQGLFALDLVTKQQQLISVIGQRPVVSGNVLIWSEQVGISMGGAVGESVSPTTEWQLHLKVLDSSEPSSIIARSKGQFSTYNVSGDTVVWSSLPPTDDLRVFSYNIASGAKVALSPGWASNPVLRGDTVIWTAHPEKEQPGRVKEWMLQRRSRKASLNSAMLVSQGTAQTAARAILPNQQLLFLAYTNADTGRPSLRLTDLSQPALTLNSTAGQAVGTAAVPSSQITKSGKLLYENGVRWKMKGVMFLLPDYGINHKQFETSNFTSSAGARAYWLDLAGPGWIKANTVRIFVEMNSNTTPDSVYNFALEADAKNMRVGVVLKNYADFSMTTTRRQWLLNLINKFKNNNKTHLIAYVSAHNEINNHCSASDCYDQADKIYMTNANSWVYEFNKVFKDAGSPILTTVGISTEVANTDGQPAVYDFFKPDNNNRRLADLVDFISPHNYGGGAYGIINEVQSKGYAGPVVLEEFGFPTDSVAKNASYTEGAAACRADPGFPTNSPNYNLCKNTATYYVEVNARAMRDLTNDYAGGVSWMLADMNSHPCSGSGYAPDNFTGLFSVGGSYCGGTTSTATVPDDKSTAFRILTHHIYY